MKNTVIIPEIRAGVLKLHANGIEISYDEFHDLIISLCMDECINLTMQEIIDNAIEAKIDDIKFTQNEETT